MKKTLALVLFFGLMGLYACDNEASPQEKRSNNGGSPQPDIDALYDMKCGICHGREGNLMVGGAPDLTKSTLDLQGRIQIITYGKNTMPPQKDLLSADQIEGLAKYIENFRSN